jgi:hypothetical protein
MSTRPGQLITNIISAVALGGATGRTFTMPNTATAALVSIRLVWITTATVGNRSVNIRIIDGGGNILWEGAAFTVLTASNTWHILAGSGVPVNASGVYQYVTLPFDMPVQGNNTQIQVLDVNNVDPTDTVAITTVLAL